MQKENGGQRVERVVEGVGRYYLVEGVGGMRKQPLRSGTLGLLALPWPWCQWEARRMEGCSQLPFASRVLLCNGANLSKPSAQLQLSLKNTYPTRLKG